MSERMNRDSLDWKGGFISRGEAKAKSSEAPGQDPEGRGPPAPRAQEEGAREVRVQGSHPGAKKTGATGVSRTWRQQ